MRGRCNLAEPIQTQKGYSRFQALRLSVLPSFGRALHAIWGPLAFPLFILALIMTASAFERIGIVEFGPISEYVTRYIRKFEMMSLSWLDLHFPFRLNVLMLEFASLYLSIGNAIVRSEKGELMSEYSFSLKERAGYFLEGIKKARLDTWLPVFPRWLRGIIVRIIWPAVALHRLYTPYIIEGPGPDDDLISSAVPSDEITEFTSMVAEAGKLDQQIIHDQRQIIFWQIAFGAGLAFLLSLG